jgi:hypothetical protein
MSVLASDEGKVSEKGMVFVGLFGSAEQTDKHHPF